MYNIIHARRPTDRRPEADARDRTPGRPSNACAQGARQARGYRFIRGDTEVRGRVGLVTPRVGATRTASHERRARNLRSGLRRVWIQAQAPQTASTVTGSIPRVPPFFRHLRERRPRPGLVPGPRLRDERNLLLVRNLITPDDTRKLSPMSPVCFVTHVAGCTVIFFLCINRLDGVRVEARAVVHVHGPRSAGALVLVHLVFAEVQLGHVGVVSFTHEPNIVRT